MKFDMTSHGVTVNLTPINIGEQGRLFIKEEYFPICCDNENIYYYIEKPKNRISKN